MILFIGTVYVIGWFLLSVSLLFTVVAMARGKNTYMKLAVPFALCVGVPVYLAGSYLRVHLESPSALIFWIPLILGGICGAIAGYGMEDGK